MPPPAGTLVAFVAAAYASSSKPSMARSRTRCPEDTTVSGWCTEDALDAAGAVRIKSAALPRNASAPPTSTTRQDLVDTGGSEAGVAAPRTARVVIRTACPSSRLTIAAVASAIAVQSGVFHANAVLAARHHSVK